MVYLCLHRAGDWGLDESLLKDMVAPRSPALPLSGAWLGLVPQPCLSHRCFPNKSAYLILLWEGPARQGLANYIY